MTDQDQFDLDEDLFCFEEILQEQQEPAAKEESLESIFATFQSDEDASEAEAESAYANAEAELEFATHDDDLPDLVFSDDEASPAPQANPAGAAPAAKAGAPNAATGAAPKLVAAIGVGAFTKSALLILISVTMLNGLVGFVVLRQSSNIMENVNNTGSSLLITANQIKRNTLEHTQERLRDGVPLPVWDVENHPTFELAAEAIENGDYQGACKMLNTFLSVIDGIDPSVREDMEARARLLIASANQQAAIARALEDI